MCVSISKLVTNALFHLFHKQHKQIHLKCKILIIFSDKFIGSNEDSFLKLFWLRRGFNKKFGINFPFEWTMNVRSPF